ncbi:MAG: hypothetical protein ABF532_09120 [Bifidobacterium sp.]|jgi:hypothetical protein|uniref:hypothetical protein n=1 Tax=Bifidobacterium sp. TaxID=41200 RepID=UPI0039EC326E
MSVPAITDGSLAILAKDPGALSAQAERLGLSVTDATDPDSAEGRMLTAMCGTRECAISRPCEHVAVISEQLPEPQDGQTRSIKDPKAKTEPETTTSVLPVIRPDGGPEAETMEFPRAARDMELKEHLRLLIEQRVTEKLGDDVDLTPVLGTPGTDGATRRAIRKEGQSS